MISAFTLALGDLGDRQVVAVLIKSIGVTLLLFAILGAAGWWGLDALLAFIGLRDASFEGAEAARGLISLLAVIIGGWLLWRIIALAVLQFFADEVVAAVEARHYPAQHAVAKPLAWQQELRVGLRGVRRALGYNLLALPFALVLLITGIGPALVFWAVNAVLLGRELTEMAWVRHTPDPAAPPPLSWQSRFVLGGGIAALLVIPFVNFLAPVLGAAMATHLVHRKGTAVHAA